MTNEANVLGNSFGAANGPTGGYTPQASDRISFGVLESAFSDAIYSQPDYANASNELTALLIAVRDETRIGDRSFPPAYMGLTGLDVADPPVAPTTISELAQCLLDLATPPG